MSQISSGRLEKRHATVYIVHDGTERDRHNMERLATHLDRRTKQPIIIISARSEEGRELVRRYHLRGSHFVLIVRASGDLHHMWTDGDHLDAPHIAQMAEHAT